MIRWQKHCEKGVTDIRRDRRKEGWTEVFYKSCLVAAKNTRCRPDDFGLGSEVVVCNTGITWSINATLTPKLSLHCLVLCNGGGGLRYCFIIVGKFYNRLKNVTRYSCLTTVISAILPSDVHYKSCVCPEMSRCCSYWCHNVWTYPVSKVHDTYMGPTWDRQDPGGPHESCYQANINMKPPPVSDHTESIINCLGFYRLYHRDARSLTHSLRRFNLNW